VVLLFSGVGLVVGNGQCIVGQSSSRKDQSVMIVSSIVSWCPESEREGRRLLHCCLVVAKLGHVVGWHIFDEGSWSFSLQQFGFAMGFGV